MDLILQEKIVQTFIGKINNCPIFVNPKGDPRETTGYNKKLVIETYKSHL